MSDITPVVDPPPAADPPPADPPADDGLGENGKRALEAERKAAKDAEKRAKAAEKELETLRAASATDAEKAIAAAKAEGLNEGLAKSHARIVKAEIKAAAAGVLANPDIADRLIDPDQFEVDEDGNVDTKAIKAEVDRLVQNEPYLAAGAKPTALPGGGATPSQGHSMDDLLRSAARGKGL